MEPDVRDDPPFERRGRTKSAVTIEERSQATVHVLNRVRRCGEPQIGVFMVRTEIVPPPERRSNDAADTYGATFLICEASEFVTGTPHTSFISITEHQPNKLLHLLPFLPPYDPAFPVPTERRELAEEMKVTTLEHPPLLVCNGTHTRKTVSNDRTNALFRSFRDWTDDLPPLLL